MNTIGKVISLLILIFSVMYVALFYSSDRADAITQSYIQMHTDQFYSEVKHQGKITMETYSDFLMDLAVANKTMKVELEHTHSSVDPVYDIHNNFTGQTVVNYYTFYEDEIIKELETNGVYYLTKDDTISIAVYNTAPTTYSSIRIMLGMGRAGVDIGYFTGGAILDES